MEAYAEVNRKLGKKQYLVPYFISSHPGADLKDAVQLAEFLRDIRFQPEQVQDFIPTPGSLSTCIYYTGIDPFSGKKVHVPKDRNERKMQRALLQYREPKNRETVISALKAAGRPDLVGEGPRCLVREQHKETRRGRESSPADSSGKRKRGGKSTASPRQGGGRKEPSRGPGRSPSEGRRPG
jgi:hypothetical protein